MSLDKITVMPDKYKPAFTAGSVQQDDLYDRALLAKGICSRDYTEDKMDAHFQVVNVPDVEQCFDDDVQVSEAGQKAPRYSKGGLQHLEDRLGCKPKVSYVVLDIDAPEEEEKGPEALDCQYHAGNRAIKNIDLENSTAEGAAPDSWLRKVASALSSTVLGEGMVWAGRGGLTVLFPLKYPVSWDKWKPFYENLLKQFEERSGLEIDEACSDPTRLNRCPFVARQDEKELRGYGEYTRQDTWNNFIGNFTSTGMGELPFIEELDAIEEPSPEQIRAESLAPSGEVDGPTKMPPPDEIEHQENALNKKDVKPLRPEEGALADKLYEPQPLAEEGERHRTLLEEMGIVAEKLGCTRPKKMLQLFWPSITLANEQAGHPYKMEEAWKVAMHVCEQEAGQQEKQEKEAQESIDNAIDAIDALDNPGEVRDALFLLESDSDTYYPLDPRRGEYRATPVSSRALKAKIKKCMPSLCAKYDLLDKDKDTLSSDHATVIEDTVIDYTARYTDVRTKNDSKGRVELRIAAASIDKTLKARRHPLVEKVLKIFAPENYELLLDWLSIVPDVDQPLPLLYIEGDPGIGKTAFCRGLARLYQEDGDYTKWNDLVGDFQSSSVKECPLFVADEGIETSRFGDDMSKTFRKVMGESTLEYEEKFHGAVRIKGNVRAVVTANNPDGIPVNTGLNQTDLDAIKQRIISIEPDGSAMKGLIEQKKEEHNLDSTREFFKMIVEEKKLAEHVLWLHENRDVEPGDRYAIRSPETKITREIELNYGAVRPIAQYIKKAINRQEGFEKSGVFVDDNNDIWACKEQLMKHWRSRPWTNSESYNHGAQAVKTALDILSTDEGSTKHYTDDAGCIYPLTRINDDKMFDAVDLGRERLAKRLDSYGS